MYTLYIYIYILHMAIENSYKFKDEESMWAICDKHYMAPYVLYEAVHFKTLYISFKLHRM